MIRDAEAALDQWEQEIVRREQALSDESRDAAVISAEQAQTEIAARQARIEQLEARTRELEAERAAALDEVRAALAESPVVGPAPALPASDIADGDAPAGTTGRVGAVPATDAPAESDVDATAGDATGESAAAAGPQAPASAAPTEGVPGSYPMLSERVLSSAEIQELSGGDSRTLGLMRNEIFARNGYKFAPESFYGKHFGAQAWYSATPPPDGGNDAVYPGLTEIEARNVSTIKGLERPPQTAAPAPKPGGKQAAPARRPTAGCARPKCYRGCLRRGHSASACRNHCCKRR